jgi:hypothetical protein
MQCVEVPSDVDRSAGEVERARCATDEAIAYRRAATAGESEPSNAGQESDSMGACVGRESSKDARVTV